MVTIELTIIKEHLALIKFKREYAMNAFSFELLEEFNEALNQIEQMQNVHVLIITGEGARAFSAGADLKERRGMNEAETIQAVQRIGSTINRVANLEIPVIAAINGVAFGGGLELALACDIRIAAAHAQMGLTETSLAIIPGAGGTQRLSRLIGSGQAKKLIFSAAKITAEEALKIGMIEELYKSENLLEECIILAEKISANGPIAVKLAKQTINDGLETSLELGLKLEHLNYQQTLGTEDRREGLNAFKEKRKPKYKGF